jgi:hypothetical protein
LGIGLGEYREHRKSRCGAELIAFDYVRDVGCGDQARDGSLTVQAVLGLGLWFRVLIAHACRGALGVHGVGT